MTDTTQTQAANPADPHASNWGIAGLIESIVSDFTQTTDAEQQREAAFQLGAMQAHLQTQTSRHDPDPSRGEEEIAGINRAVLQLIEGLTATADEHQRKGINEGIAWSNSNQTEPPTT